MKDREVLAQLVAQSKSYRQVLISLGLRPAGGNYERLRLSIKREGLDTSHFTGKGWNLGSLNLKRRKYSLTEICVNGSSDQSNKLRNRLIDENVKLPKCESCGWSKARKDGRIPLELHHKDGNRYNNTLENLQILCPNCHALQESHRGRNKGTY